MKALAVTIAVLMAWGTAMAAEVPSIVQGYGKTRWGQTRQEVAALVTPSPTKPNTQDHSRIPNIVVAGDGQSTGRLLFGHDRLGESWSTFLSLPILTLGPHVRRSEDH